jgi:hypothetical protein
MVLCSGTKIIEIGLINHVLAVTGINKDSFERQDYDSKGSNVCNYE